MHGPSLDPSEPPGAAVASVVVRAGWGRSEVLRARQAGPLRLLFPRAAGNAAWIVTSSLGGGLVDGDDVALEVTALPGSTSLITTQSSTKIYRGTARQRLAVVARGDAAALVVPDPVVAFRDARFTQRTTIALDREASLVLADVITAGRVAYGERWSAAHLDTALTISVGGEPRVLDRIVLDPAHGDVAQRLRRFEALATAVLVGPRVAAHAIAQLARIATLPIGPVVIVGSPITNGAVFRVAGDRVETVVAAVRELLRDACASLGEDPWSRKW